MNGFRTRLSMALLLSALLAATITLLEPAKSAIGNWHEIGLTFSDLLARLAAPFAIAFFAIATIAVFFTAVSPRRSIPVLVALYVVLWAQGSVFVWNYGTFDGSPVDWSEHSGKGLLELVFWAATLALALTKPDWIRPLALRITVIVVAAQLASLAGQVRQNAPPPEKIDSEESGVHAELGATKLDLIRSVNHYSRDLNVIIVVLDGLQSDFFAEAMREPELRAAMPPGFTYYRNAISLYALTEYSLPSILTSRAVPDRVYYLRWREKNKTRSLPAKLAERGFGTVLTTLSLPNFHDFGEWGYNRILTTTLAASGSASAAWRQDVSNMFALGLFRLSPHFLKPQIYDDGRWQSRRLYPPRETVWQDPRIQHETRTDLAAFDELIASASAGEIAPQFRFLHFYGAHRPRTVDESCSYSNTPVISRTNAIATTHCMLSRLFEFLHKLDEIGVYDQSLIFVVADHGDQYVPLDLSTASPGLPEGEAPRAAASNRETKPIDYHWQGVPLFLAKPLGDRKPLRVSDHAVSLCDVPKSVFDALAIEDDFKCESIFSGRSPRQAPRMHYRYPNFFERSRLGISLLDGLTFEKFKVVGHSWRPESWVAVAADGESSRMTGENRP